MGTTAVRSPFGMAYFFTADSAGKYLQRIRTVWKYQIKNGVKYSNHVHIRHPKRSRLRRRKHGFSSKNLFMQTSKPTISFPAGLLLAFSVAFVFRAIHAEPAETVLQSLVVENQRTDGDGPLEVLFEDVMHGDWQEKWFLDGKKATLEPREGGLYFAGGTVTKEDDPVEYNAHHAVLWTKQVFEGDIRISYQMKQVDASGYGNTLLYIHAQGIGTPPYVEDIHEWRNLREVPDMSTYFTYMDLLSLSLRENIRCKRYPWRDEKLQWYPTQGLIEPMVDYPGVIPGETYQVIVDKKGDSLRLRLYNQSGATLHVDHTWDTSQIAEGIEPRKIQKGRIGIRHMATKQSIYNNFKVEKL